MLVVISDCLKVVQLLLDQTDLNITPDNGGHWRMGHAADSCGVGYNDGSTKAHLQLYNNKVV